MMNHVLSGLQGTKCYVYLDDIIVFGQALEEHNNNLKSVLSKLQEFKIKVEPEKCKFLRNELCYLGHVITDSAVKPDPGNVNSVREFPTPTSQKQVRLFLGLALGILY